MSAFLDSIYSFNYFPQFKMPKGKEPHTFLSVLDAELSLIPEKKRLLYQAALR